MRNRIFLLAILGICTLLSRAAASADTTTIDTISLEQLYSKLDTYKYQHTGKINIGEVAILDIPAGFKFLDGPQASSVLHDVWKNPYSPSLGLLLPENKSVYRPDCWAVELTYEEEGHVKDDDAKGINYTDLLGKMQEQIREANPERIKQGGKAIELTGWAEQPSYDAISHKLYWAKKLKEVGDSTEFLNYNIRILGRKGVLVLNAIGGLDQLADIKQQTPTILAATNFTNGNTYSEFNSSVDKVAAYGIVGLIAGGVLAKTGLLAKIGIVLLKFLKPALAGIAAIFAGIMRFFKGKKNDDNQPA